MTSRVRSRFGVASAGRARSYFVMLIVFNPTAGRRRAHLLWRVLDVLALSGVRFTVAETQHAGHAVDLARAAGAAGHELCVAAGGDGTVAEVAQGLDGHGPALGIIPLGTANVLAQELRLSFAPAQIAAALALGRTQALWPGLAQGPRGTRLFVQMLGAGFDARVVHRLPLSLKRFAGRGAYVMQTLRELPRYDFAPVHIRIDGVELSAASVIVSKGRLYGGNYLLAPDAATDMPGFSVALFDRSGIWPALLYGAALPMNRLPRTRGFRLVRAAAIDILSHSPAQADGDPAGDTPLTIRDALRPIRVAVGKPEAGR